MNLGDGGSSRVPACLCALPQGKAHGHAGTRLLPLSPSFKVAWPYKLIRQLLASSGQTYMHTKTSVRLPRMDNHEQVYRKVHIRWGKSPLLVERKVI